MFKTVSSSTILFLTIIFLASVLRLYNIQSVPPSMYWDENSLAYDAYSILKTGKDHHGNPYPIVAFPSFGDYKPGGYIYAIVPFQAVFGLTPLATRLPSALSGIISVVCLYFIGKELIDKRFGLLASFLYAVQPWSLQFSRAGFEVNLATMFLTIGACCFLLARKKPWFLFVAAIMFCASMYTYQAARVFAPLMGVVAGILLIVYWVRNKVSVQQWLPSTIVSVAIALVCVSPIVLNVQSKEVSNRLTEVGIFTNIEPILQSNAAIAEHGNAFWARLIFHRYIFFGMLIGKSWLSFFDPTFLFLRGDGNGRHGTNAFGLVYHIEALFIVITLVAALASLVRPKKLLKWLQLSPQQSQMIGLSLTWIAVAALPGSLATPTPHALRFLIASPASALLSACGLGLLLHVLTQYHSRVGKIILWGVISASIGCYLWYYHTVYPVLQSNDWQYGYTQLYQEIFAKKLPGEQVYVSRMQGRPSMYYFVASEYDPAVLQAKDSQLPKDQLEILDIDDYHFVDAIPQGQGLFATSPDQVGLNAQVLQTINGLDGSEVWVVWRK